MITDQQARHCISSHCVHTSTAFYAAWNWLTIWASSILLRNRLLPTSVPKCTSGSQTASESSGSKLVWLATVSAERCKPDLELHCGIDFPFADTDAYMEAYYNQHTHTDGGLPQTAHTHRWRPTTDSTHTHRWRPTTDSTHTQVEAYYRQHTHTDGGLPQTVHTHTHRWRPTTDSTHTHTQMEAYHRQHTHTDGGLPQTAHTHRWRPITDSTHTQMEAYHRQHTHTDGGLPQTAHTHTDGGLPQKHTHTHRWEAYHRQHAHIDGRSNKVMILHSYHQLQNVQNIKYTESSTPHN